MINPAISIVIPCYNEASVIGVTVQKLAATFDNANVSYEILCVNNASTDSTESTLKRLAEEYKDVRYINTPSIAGYGVAVRWGLEFYLGDAVVIVMADGSEQPDEVLNFCLKLEEGYDCVFGSRFYDSGLVKDYPFFKKILNRSGNWLISKLTRISYNDYTNGFKCFKREVVDSMSPLLSDHFNLTIEMSINAVMSGAKFAVLPNHWQDRDDGESKFKLIKQCQLYLFTIAYCLLRNKLKGKNSIAFKKAVNETKSLLKG